MFRMLRLPQVYTKKLGSSIQGLPGFQRCFAGRVFYQLNKVWRVKFCRRALQEIFEPRRGWPGGGAGRRRPGGPRWPSVPIAREEKAKQYQ